MCGKRAELENSAKWVSSYLPARIGFDTAEKEPTELLKITEWHPRAGGRPPADWVEKFEYHAHAESSKIRPGQKTRPKGAVPRTRNMLPQEMFGKRHPWESARLGCGAAVRSAHKRLANYFTPKKENGKYLIISHDSSSDFNCFSNEGGELQRKDRSCPAVKSKHRKPAHTGAEKTSRKRK